MVGQRWSPAMVMETVDTLYEGVRKTQVCKNCVRKRRRAQTRVMLLQLRAGGVFHMRTLKHVTICGMTLI